MSESYDIVITDQTMPKMTGYQLSTELLNIRPDVPIILCTGFSEMVTEEKAKEAGIRDFVLKPFSRDNIARKIRKVLGQHKSCDHPLTTPRYCASWHISGRFFMG